MVHDLRLVANLARMELDLKAARRAQLPEPARPRAASRWSIRYRAPRLRRTGVAPAR